jgi:hypothetical protein
MDISGKFAHQAELANAIVNFVDSAAALLNVILKKVF